MRVKAKDKFDFPQELCKQLNPPPPKKKKVSPSTGSLDSKNAGASVGAVLDESDDCEATEATTEQIAALPTMLNSLLSTLPTNEEVSNDSQLTKVNNATYRRNYSDAHNSNLENTRYALVTNKNGNTRTALKQPITWLLENSVTARSAERLIRVKQPASTPDHRHSQAKQVEKKAIQQGDWCVLETAEKDDYLLGRVEVLTNVHGKTNERFVSEWEWDEAADNCDIQTLCSWFNIQRTAGIFTGKLEETQMISNGYFPCKYYVCSVPMPVLDE